MDVLVSYCCGMGLLGLSINWGVWVKGGMVVCLGI